MTEKFLNSALIDSYREQLVRDEKSTATIEKYLRDVRAFFAFIGERALTKEEVITYKQFLIEKQYSVKSINSMLVSVNSLLAFLGWSDCRVKSIRQQRQIYCTEEKELTKSEYLRLLEAAKKKPQLRLVMETICGTGIRVSELRYFTVEAVRRGEIVVNCKAKTRTILLPGKLRKLLLDYAKKNQIVSGSIFVTRNGNPLNRSNIWSDMKKLCETANVKAS